MPRDPLSVRYDRTANAMVVQAIAQHEKHAKNQRLVPYVRFRVDNPRGVAREPDDRALSVNERALQRSLYHHPKIYQFTGRAKPEAEWSLRLDWEPVPVGAGRARYLRVTVFDPVEAALYAQRLPEGKKWTTDPALRSSPGNRPGRQWEDAGA